MGLLATTSLTLLDWAKRTDPDGKNPIIIEILTQVNEVLQDMLWSEGNLPTGHKTTIRSGLPTPTWRLLNYGVQPTKSTTVQVTDTTGQLEAYSEVDKKLADLNGNTAAFRASEDKGFLEGMNQMFSSTLFYGNARVNPERFTGLAPRYSTISGASNGQNIVSGGGTQSANTSIWLVQWGDLTCHGIFPKGTKAGFQMEDKGQVTLWDSQTPPGKYEGYQTHYQWDCGLTLRDWRSCVRIANIDVNNLTKNAASGADVIDLIVQALEIPPNLQMGRPVIYCNKGIKSFLRRQMANKSNARLNFEEVMGKHVMTFDGIPVKRCDALLNTEATVS